MSRILTALVAVPLLLLIILAGPSWLFLALALVSALVAYWELSHLARNVGWTPLGSGYLAVAAVVLSFYPGFPGFLEASVVAVAVIVLSAVYSRGPSRETLAEVATTFLATTYLGSCLGCLVGLRMTAPDQAGRYWLLFLMAVVMVGDAGAFFVGRSLGRHQLAPVLSPRKTTEGLVGGAIASVGAAVLLRRLIFPSLAWPSVIALGISLALFGVVGDLFESLLKRSAGIKDTSSLIPGHGGLLDRIDSLLFTAPLLFLYVRWTSDPSGSLEVLGLPLQ
jgi:phosphatidate cytidylyltransferase